MRKVPTKTPRRNKSRIAPGPLDIGTLRSCEGPTVFQLSLDPARLSFYCGFCKRIHEWVREFKEMECQMAWSRRLSELRFDPNPQFAASAAEMICIALFILKAAGRWRLWMTRESLRRRREEVHQWSRNRRFSIAVSNQKQASRRLSDSNRVSLGISCGRSQEFRSLASRSVPSFPGCNGPAAATSIRRIQRRRSFRRKRARRTKTLHRDEAAGRYH